MKNIRTMRTMRGETLEEVANAIGISKQRYSQIENTNNGAASEAVLRKIAAYFGIGFFELLGDDALRFKPRDEAERQEVLRFVTRQD